MNDATFGDFVPFPKISRLSRDMIITEKIDGTNAQIAIEIAGAVPPDRLAKLIESEKVICIKSGDIDFVVMAGSRTRWISPKDDNHGFANWVWKNANELVNLGPGNHFGEWWGAGIQRKYGIGEKRFSLFNVSRWSDAIGKDASSRPTCCHVVPLLYTGMFDTNKILEVMEDLKTHGSYASDGFKFPEGVVIFHTPGGYLFKKTFEKDEAGKGE